VASPNATKYRKARKEAKELYESGVTDVDVLARRCDVKPNTVKRWIAKGKWQTYAERTAQIQQEIEDAADECLLKALEEFKKDPANKDLQSLNSMLKSYLERRKPDRKLLEYIIRFVEDVVEFAIATNNDQLRTVYQENIAELSDFLRKKYA
jgi:hypothetical protein